MRFQFKRFERDICKLGWKVLLTKSDVYKNKKRKFIEKILDGDNKGFIILIMINFGLKTSYNN